MTIKVVVQNLHKRYALATELIKEHDPDIMLTQAMILPSEAPVFNDANNVSSPLGYGTGIYGGVYEMTDVKKVDAAHSESILKTHKRTTVATMKSVQFVSFHGYEAKSWKNVEKLLEHIRAVLNVLTPGPVLFAGDFNTLTNNHVEAVKEVMENAGFELAYSWPYKGAGSPLDHAFVRGLTLVSSSNYVCASDHRGAVLEISMKGE